MKRGTPNHPKLRKLGRTLGIPAYAAIGVCEAIWHHTAAYAPRGDIGRWQDDEIADSIGWPVEDAKKLVAGLVAAGLLDEHDDPYVRLVIHDWSTHAEDAVHMRLARERARFADGKMPSLAKFSKAEREQILADYDEPVPTNSHAVPRNAPAVPTDVQKKALPLPLATCHSHSHGHLPTGQCPKASAFSKLTEQVIRDPAKLLAWYEQETRKKKPVIEHSEANRLRVFAAAERAIEKDHRGTPVGLFAWLVSGARWDYITGEQEERGRQKLKALLTAAPSPQIEHLSRELAESLKSREEDR